ncbi:MAG: heme exporter protein CcmD [Myxococcota bacterium]
MTQGVIEGGWEYVWAAYAVTWTALVGYTLYLWRQRRLADDELRATGEDERS